MNAKPTPTLHLQQKAGLADELATILLQRIETGELKVGDALPPEKILADTYQVSRTVVREALVQLKYENIIISRRGSGSVVVGTTPKRSFNLGGSSDVTSFFEFRMLLDSEASAMAAVRHTKEHAARMYEHLNRLELTGEEQSNNADPDYRFHYTIAEAADNDYIKLATQQLSTKMWSHIYTAKMFPHNQQVYAEHMVIYEAITRRDSSAARAASVMHLVSSAARRGIELDLRHLVWNPASLSYL